MQGENGVQSQANGVQGTKGTQGADGTKGDNGTQGTNGPQGETGVQSQVNGVQGTKGVQSQANGVQGTKGSKGEKGTQGGPGDKGKVGVHDVNNKLILNNDFGVYGDSSFNDVSMNGNVDIIGTLTVSKQVNTSINNTVVIDNTIHIMQDLSINDNLYVTGDISFNSTGQVDICGELRAVYPDDTIPQSALIGGLLDADKKLSLNANLFVGSDVSFNSSNLFVDGDITINDIMNTSSTVTNTTSIVHKSLENTTIPDFNNFTLSTEVSYQVTHSDSFHPFQVAYSYDGSIMAISDTSNNTSYGTAPCTIRIYKRNTSYTTNNSPDNIAGWEHLASTSFTPTDMENISDSHYNNYVGTSIAIRKLGTSSMTQFTSNDKLIIAIGSEYNVYVNNYTTSSDFGTWISLLENTKKTNNDRDKINYPYTSDTTAASNWLYKEKGCLVSMNQTGDLTYLSIVCDNFDNHHWGVRTYNGKFKKLRHTNHYKGYTGMVLFNINDNNLNLTYCISSENIPSGNLPVYDLNNLHEYTTYNKNNLIYDVSSTRLLFSLQGLTAPNTTYGSSHNNLPPYYITLEPSNGTTLTNSDITNTLLNYNGYKQARYVYVQLQQNDYFQISELEIYDETGTNIVYLKTQGDDAKISTDVHSGWKIDFAFNGIINNIPETGTTYNSDMVMTKSAVYPWIGVDLGQDTKISGIRVYMRTNFTPSDWGYKRSQPFVIYLYPSEDFSVSSRTLSDGPINNDNYQLRSTRDSTANGPSYYDEIIIGEGSGAVGADDDFKNKISSFYFGIEARIGNNVESYPSNILDLYKNIITLTPYEVKKSFTTLEIKSNISSTDMVTSGFTSFNDLSINTIGLDNVVGEVSNINHNLSDGAMNKDGTRIVIQGSHSLEVYHRPDNNSNWNQIQSIKSSNSRRYGGGLAMNSDGKYIATLMSSGIQVYTYIKIPSSLNTNINLTDGMYCQIGTSLYPFSTNLGFDEKDVAQLQFVDNPDSDNIYNIYLYVTYSKYDDENYDDENVSFAIYEITPASDDVTLTFSNKVTTNTTSTNYYMDALTIPSDISYGLSSTYTYFDISTNNVAITNPLNHDTIKGKNIQFEGFNTNFTSGTNTSETTVTNVTVDSRTTLNNITTTTNATYNATPIISFKDSNSVTFTKDISFNKNVDVSENMVINGDISFSTTSVININNNLNMDGDASLNYNLYVKKSIDINNETINISYDNCNLVGNYMDGSAGTASRSYFGYCTDITSNGTRIIVGAPGTVYNNSPQTVNPTEGYVEVYDYNSNSNTWNRVGNKIWYEDDVNTSDHPRIDSSNNKFGHSVAISENGTIIGIGAPNVTTNGNGDTIGGIVGIYEFDNTNWNLLGNYIEGEYLNSKGRFGYSISLNNNGNRIAIGDPYYNSVQGRILAYDYNGTNWNQIGQSGNMQGDFSWRWVGTYLSMSGNGDYIVSTNRGQWSNHYDLIGEEDCEARVYKINSGGTNWLRIGEGLKREKYDRDMITQVDISEDGTTVAYVEYHNQDDIEPPIVSTNSNDKGKGIVRVFKYRTVTKSEWDNANTTNYLGSPGVPVIMAGQVGAKRIHNIGTPFVPSWDANTEYWIQIGDDFNYENFDGINTWGNSTTDKSQILGISLSHDGTILAIGIAYPYSRIMVYKYNSLFHSWYQISNYIRPDNSVNFGAKISLSRNGDFIVAGDTHVPAATHGIDPNIPEWKLRTGRTFVHQIPNTNGKVHIHNNLHVNGSVSHVNGTLSKTAGTFKIDHPLPEKQDSHYLVHSFVEGPRVDNIYRGHINLVNGFAEINLDTQFNMTEGTFIALNRNITVFTSNEETWDKVNGKVTGNILKIKCKNSNSSALVTFLVIGERKDQGIIKSIMTDEEGYLITEPLQ